MPQSYKDEMWRMVESKFKFLPSCTDEIKKWILSNISDKWRYWKSEVKAKWFIEQLTVDQMWEDVSDPRISELQFKILAQHWISDKAKEMSLRNKKNRANLKDPHCLGTKSFPRIIHEKSKDDNGSKPSRVQLYISSRTRKDGSIVSSEAAEYMDLMKKGLGDSISTGTSDDLLSLDGDIFSHVKGPEKPGRIRCVGQLATSKKFEASSSQTKQPSECCAEWKERVVGLEALLGSLIVFMQKENPNNSNLNEFISAANQLCNKETPDAGSALIISPARLPSSSNDSNQNGTSNKS